MVDEWKDCYFYVVESGRLFVGLKKDKTTVAAYHADVWVKAEEVRDG